MKFPNLFNPSVEKATAIHEAKQNLDVCCSEFKKCPSASNYVKLNELMLQYQEVVKN